jgi:hypothetical protein
MSSETQTNIKNKKTKVKRLVCGVGINDADYVTSYIVNGKQKRCPFYITWKSMLTRCYNQKSLIKNPTYIGCSVCDEWLKFSTFKAWMETQNWQGLCLDKDILDQHNKIYSPETCLFVTKAINVLFTKSDNVRGSYKIGVSFSKSRNKFKAACNTYNNKKELGYYLTEDEAHNVYKIFKLAHIRNLALEQTDERLKSAMLKYTID